MPIQLAPKVYWVGAIDWDIREFHGYVTEKGTTYNAFLILDDKITLIDTVKKEFLPEMLARIVEIVDPEKIDYIVSNHVEMDHSGGLPGAMALIKPEKLFCSPMGKAGLRRHYQQDWPFVEVKTGQEVELGSRRLLFLETPMLHWPDSMMTCLKEEQILFPSDGFGAHFASGERFDLETPDPAAYFHQVKKYYANILMPFGSLITRLFKTISELNLEFKLIAPDHGLLLRNPAPILDAYQKWAAGSVLPKALIIYDTMWHSTELLAHALTEGLMDAGAETISYRLRRTHYSDIVTGVLDAGLLLFGSPTLNNNMFPSMGEFLTYLQGLKPQNKAAAAFGSYGWSGQAVSLINQVLQAMKFKLAHDGLQCKYIPTPQELTGARTLATRLAKENLKL
ncbi:MAG: FprA family A-type flavoprotein [Deltaproteobacteria bacterium]|nr:FprA family A-type flavoprotein [Deltaproteobacteria bacterium]